MPTVNVQDRANEFPDVTEILQRSRSEWLSLNDVQQISLQDLQISDDTVTDFGDGLFRFPRSNVFNDQEWPAVLPKKTRETPHLRYDFSRINLGSLGADGGRVYERRVYKPYPLDVYGHYVFAHYIRYDTLMVQSLLQMIRVNMTMPRVRIRRIKKRIFLMRLRMKRNKVGRMKNRIQSMKTTVWSSQFRRRLSSRSR